MLKKLALNGLDPQIFARQKRGFVLPIDAWCRDGLRRDVEAVLFDEDVCRAVGLNADVIRRLWLLFQEQPGRVYWSRVWALFVLLRWCRDHNVGLTS